MIAAEWEQILRKVWSELAARAPRARQFRTRRLSTELPLDAYGGLRAIDDALCLIIDAQAPPSALFEVAGMRLMHAVGDDGPMLVLSLEDPARQDLFATVCSDAIQAAAPLQRIDAVEAFLARLDAWRQFLRERRTGLTKNEIVGLLGELITLRRCLQLAPQSLQTWCSPDDGLHDFASGGHALEVKATLGPGASLRISNLDQLDNAGVRRLDLLHVRFAEASNGESLNDIILAIGNLLPTESARRWFENALLRRGLMPDDVAARSAPRALVQNLNGYSVIPGFPRLVRSTVPTAVMDAEYELELRAISQYVIDADAAISAFAKEAI